MPSAIGGLDRAYDRYRISAANGGANLAYLYNDTTERDVTAYGSGAGERKAFPAKLVAILVEVPDAHAAPDCVLDFYDIENPVALPATATFTFKPQRPATETKSYEEQVGMDFTKGLVVRATGTHWGAAPNCRVTLIVMPKGRKTLSAMTFGHTPG